MIIGSNIALALSHGCSISHQKKLANGLAQQVLEIALGLNTRDCSGAQTWGQLSVLTMKLSKMNCCDELGLPRESSHSSCCPLSTLTPDSLYLCSWLLQMKG